MRIRPQIKVTAIGSPNPALLSGIAELIFERIEREINSNRVAKRASDMESGKIPSKNKRG